MCLEEEESVPKRRRRQFYWTCSFRIKTHQDTLHWKVTTFKIKLYCRAETKRQVEVHSEGRAEELAFTTICCHSNTMTFIFLNSAGTILCVAFTDSAKLLLIGLFWSQFIFWTHHLNKRGYDAPRAVNDSPNSAHWKQNRVPAEWRGGGSVSRFRTEELTFW